MVLARGLSRFFILWMGLFHLSQSAFGDVTDKQKRFFKETVDKAVEGKALVVLQIDDRLDADLIGSSMAMKAYFEEKGLKVVLVQTGSPHWVMDSDKVAGELKKEFEEAMGTKSLSEKIDEMKGDSTHALVLTLDTARLGAEATIAQLKKAGINTSSFYVDHHGDKTIETKDGVVDPGANSTGNMLYELFDRELPNEVASPMAKALLLAIRGDTSFRFSPFKVSHLSAVADLLNFSFLDFKDFYGPFNFEFIKPEVAAAIAEILSKYTVISEDGQFSAALVPSEIQKQLGKTKLRELEEALSQIEGNKALIIAYEDTAVLRLNFRSFRNAANILPMAQSYGGGGHTGAAGGSSSSGSRDDNMRQLEKFVTEMSKKLSKEVEASMKVNFKLSDSTKTKLSDFFQKPDGVTVESIRELEKALAAETKDANTPMQTIARVGEPYRFKSRSDAIGHMVRIAGPHRVHFEMKLMVFARNHIKEFKEFYDAIEKEALTDSDLNAAGFSPDQFVFMGGVVRKMAEIIHEKGLSKTYALNDIFDANRDLDMLWLHGDKLGDEVIKKAKGKLESIMSQILSANKTRVRNMELKSWKDKLATPLIREQGFDTISQAFVGAQQTGDIMARLLDGAKMKDKYSAMAISDLDKREVNYFVNEAMEDMDAFLGQLTEVFRLIKIRLEDPKMAWTKQTSENIRTILGSFAFRTDEIETYLRGADLRAKYHKHRIGDVLGWCLSKMSKDRPKWFQEIEDEFNLAKFFEKFPEISSQTIVSGGKLNIVGALPPKSLPSGELQSAASAIDIGDSLEFDASAGTLTKKAAPKKKGILSFGKGSGAATMPVYLYSSARGGVIHTKAISGTDGAVDAVLLPFNQFEILKMKKFRGPRGSALDKNFWLALVKNKTTGYSNIVIMDPSDAQPEFIFLNGRAFQRNAQAGRHASGGATTAPMFKSIDFEVVGDEIIILSEIGRASKFAWSGGSFIVSPIGLQAPKQGGYKQMLIENNELYTLFDSGALVRTDAAGKSSQIESNIVAIYRNDQGQLSFIRKESDQSLTLLVKDFGKDDYRSTKLAANIDTIKTSDSVIHFSSQLVTPLTQSASPSKDYHLKKSSEILSDLNSLKESILKANPELKTQMEPLSQNYVKPETLTDSRDGSTRGFISQVGDILGSRKGASEDIKKKIHEFLVLRLMLEMRRGIEVEFGALPNSFVLSKLIEVISAHSLLFTKSSAQRLKPLQDMAQASSLFVRDSTMPSQWKDNAVPTWTSYTVGGISKISVPAHCLADLGELAAASGGH